MSKDSWLEFPIAWSTSPSKRRRLAQESYLQEVVCEIRDCFPNLIDLPVWNKTFVIFKPDAAAVKCVEKTLDILASVNIYPIFAALFSFNRHIFRELWRYELNIATYQRYSAVDSLLAVSPSLFMLLECPDGQCNGDLAKWLDANKGDSKFDRRIDSSIRAQINARDGLLNHIHCPEEVVDVLREIGVIFDSPYRSKLIPKLTISANDRVCLEQIIQEFYSHTPSHSLLLDELRTRFMRIKKNLDFESLVEEGSQATNFELFWQRLNSLNLRASRWDALTLYVAKRKLIVDGTSRIFDWEDDCQFWK